MGMFLGDGTCTWCDADPCVCGRVKKTIPQGEGTWKQLDSKPVYSNSEPHVTKGDIICEGIEAGKSVNECWVKEIKDGEILVVGVRGQKDGAIHKWTGPYMKIAFSNEVTGWQPEYLRNLKIGS